MPGKPIRLFIVDDHALFRESLTAVLSAERDLEMVGHGSSSSEVKPKLSASRPDVLLLDMGLPVNGAFDLLREARSLVPTCKPVVVSDSETKDDIIEAMRLGARGFLRKESPVDLFLKCIRKINEGEVWLSGPLTEAVLHALGNQSTGARTGGKNALSRREYEVIELVIQGYKNKDIAQKLFISEKTVKNHLSAIFNKLGVSDRLELALYAFEKRMFPPG